MTDIEDIRARKLRALDDRITLRKRLVDVNKALEEVNSLLELIQIAEGQHFESKFRYAAKKLLPAEKYEAIKRAAEDMAQERK